MGVNNLIYAVICFCVDFYKWFERSIMGIFNTPVEKFMTWRFRLGDIIVNGERPWDIRVKNKEFFIRVANNASLGLGETYMQGYWDCDRIDEFSYRIFSKRMYNDYMHPINRLVNYLYFNVINLQTKSRAFEVGEKHYDQGNELFESFLDKSMNYSCGYWKNAKTLEEAQQAKMELIAQKLKLEKGMKVLDIGCGWAGLCKYLAEHHGVEVVGVTVSKEGAVIGKERCAKLPVDIRVQDYRDLNEKFDRIVSVGMFEHVGHNNYRTFFEVVHKCLKDDGIFLLHTIGVSHPKVPLIEPWFHKYIFPNGILPYHKQITEEIDGLFVLEDWHNFGNDYSKTLMAWYHNFVKAFSKKNGDKDSCFYRMWEFYLLMSAGAFKARKYQLWQIVLSKDGIEGGYQAAR